MLNLKPAKKGECLANPDYFNFFRSCAGWAGWKCRIVVKVAIFIRMTFFLWVTVPKGSPKVIFETETNCLVKCVSVLSDNALSHNITFHLYFLLVSWLEKCNPFLRMVICLKNQKQSLETNPSSSYQLDDRSFSFGGLHWALTVDSEDKYLGAWNLEKWFSWVASMPFWFWKTVGLGSNSLRTKTTKGDSTLLECPKSLGSMVSNWVMDIEY